MSSSGTTSLTNLSADKKAIDTNTVEVTSAKEQKLSSSFVLVALGFGLLVLVVIIATAIAYRCGSNKVRPEVADQ